MMYKKDYKAAMENCKRLWKLSRKAKERKPYPINAALYWYREMKGIEMNLNGILSVREMSNLFRD